jgi:hypothetical protein
MSEILSKMYFGLHARYRSFLADFNETWNFLDRNFEKFSNIKFHENPPTGTAVVPCERIDITKLIVAVRNFANAPKNLSQLLHSE